MTPEQPACGSCLADLLDRAEDRATLPEESALFDVGDIWQELGERHPRLARAMHAYCDEFGVMADRADDFSDVLRGVMAVIKGWEGR